MLSLVTLLVQGIWRGPSSCWDKGLKCGLCGKLFSESNLIRWNLGLIWSLRGDDIGPLLCDQPPTLPSGDTKGPQAWRSAYHQHASSYHNSITIFECNIQCTKFFLQSPTIRFHPNSTKVRQVFLHGAHCCRKGECNWNGAKGQSTILSGRIWSIFLCKCQILMTGGFWKFIGDGCCLGQISPPF